MKSSNPRIFLSVSESSITTTMRAILCYSFLPLVPFMCTFHAPKNTFTAASKYRRWTKRSSVTDIASESITQQTQRNLELGSNLQDFRKFIVYRIKGRAIFIRTGGLPFLLGRIAISSWEDCHFFLGGLPFLLGRRLVVVEYYK